MEERWLTFPAYCRKTFGRKLYRIPLDIGCTCPVRDGAIDTRGCIFCAGGSGDFAVAYTGQKLSGQDIEPFCSRDAYGSCIAYFQAYTNTYAPAEKLKPLFSAALADDMFAGISVATRPDCMPEEIMAMFKELKEAYPDKFIWVELGLQSMHEKSAVWMRRGYATPVYEDCVQRLHELNIQVITHIIIGLPNESRQDLLETIAYLNRVETDGVKLQLLHILRGTDLAEEYSAGKVRALERAEYIDLVIDCLAHLNENIVIHRLTGDGSPDILEAPLWSRAKRSVLNEIGHEMKVRDLHQGVRTMKYDKAEFIRELDKEQIPYEYTEHPVITTMAELYELHLPREQEVARNLFLRDDKHRNYYLISVCPKHRTDLRNLQEQLSSRRLSFASEKDLQEILGLLPGSVTPAGLLNDAEHKVVCGLDRGFLNGDIGIHPVSNDATVWLSGENLKSLLEKHGVTVVLLDLQEE